MHLLWTIGVTDQAVGGIPLIARMLTGDYWVNIGMAQGCHRGATVAHIEAETVYVCRWDEQLTRNKIRLTARSIQWGDNSKVAYLSQPMQCVEHITRTLYHATVQFQPPKTPHNDRHCHAQRPYVGMVDNDVQCIQARRKRHKGNAVRTGDRRTIQL